MQFKFYSVGSKREFWNNFMNIATSLIRIYKFKRWRFFSFKIGMKVL